MAVKKNNKNRQTRYWKYYKKPSLSDPYTYLTSLDSGTKAEQFVAGAAHRLLYRENIVLTMDKTKTKSLDFLQAAAENQRTQEQGLIEQRIQALEQAGKNGALIKRLKEELLGVTKGDFSYMDFISLLNEVLSGQEQFNRRLEGIAAKRGAQGQQNAINSLGTLISDFLHSRQDVNYSQEEMIRQLIVQFFSTERGKDIVTSAIGPQITSPNPNFAASLGMLQTALTEYIYDSGLLGPASRSKGDQFTYKEFVQKFEELSKKIQESHFFESDFITKLFTDDALIQEAIKEYGITVDPTSRQRARSSSRSAAAKLSSIERGIKTTVNPKAWSKLLSQLSIKTHNSSFKGALGLRQQLRTLVYTDLFGINEPGGKGGQGATDVVAIARLTCGIPDTSDIIDKALLDELYSLRQDLQDNSQGMHNVEEISRAYREAYQRIADLAKDLKSLFVVHESTKFYATVESGRWYNGNPGFHGRKMILGNYISEMAQFGGAFGYDVNWLRFVAYNLPSNALANDMASELEFYLTIAAGLIMFDDFEDMAKKALQDQTASNVNAVHLYNLQGIYVPASYFLQRTYEALTIASEEAMSASYAIKITQSAINYSNIREGSGSFKQAWKEVRNAAKSAVTIEINFARNFFDIIKNLLQ